MPSAQSLRASASARRASPSATLKAVSLLLPHPHPHPHPHTDCWHHLASFVLVLVLLPHRLARKLLRQLHQTITITLTCDLTPYRSRHLLPTPTFHSDLRLLCYRHVTTDLDPSAKYGRRSHLERLVCPLPVAALAAAAESNHRQPLHLLQPSSALVTLCRPRVTVT